MALTGTRTYVGFGFGPIQGGLFLYEAYHSGNFGRLVVVEVFPEIVAAVRHADQKYRFNVAYEDRLEKIQVGPAQIENPDSAADRRRIVAAIAAAHEIGTAVPSVENYVTDGAGSLHRLLAAGLRQKMAQNGPRAVIYTAENHHRAAEILENRVMAEIPAWERPRLRSTVCFLNTVIGKMSGVITDRQEIQAGQLATLTPQVQRAFLVEAFNQILISPVRFIPPVPFSRGLQVFQEKADLGPFEEAKLYGHNATHALAAYVGRMLGITKMAELCDHQGMMPFLRSAFVEESGAALLKKYSGVDPQFTPAGFEHHAEDLLSRMTNPYLRDTVARVGRDPGRKLGWEDRLIGTMRMTLREGVTPHRFALGAAAALAAIHPGVINEMAQVEDHLLSLWHGSTPSMAELEVVIGLVQSGWRRLHAWRKGGFRDLEGLFQDISGG